MKALVTFFSLAYLISWIIWLPLYGHVLGFEQLPVLPYHHAIGGLGPMLSALFTSWIFQKREGVRQILAQCLKIKPWFYLGIALFSPFLLMLIAAIGDLLINGTPINLAGMLYSREFPEFSLLIFFIYNLIFFGFGEETGWRGYALPILQKRFNSLNSSLLLTIFWAAWHIPLFFYRPGYLSMDTAGIFGWVFSLLTGSILLTWLYNSSRRSILICAVFHSTIDIAFTGDIPSHNIVGYMGFLITVWGILTVFLFKMWKKQGHQI